MAVSAMVLRNLGTDPLWTLLQEAFSQLLADLEHDPKYEERAKLIGKVLADPQCVQIEQIYFVPRKPAAITLSPPSEQASA